ncbi:MAG: hypothetical protein ACRDT8_08225 [Micromonosporaceae bacterium]
MSSDLGARVRDAVREHVDSVAVPPGDLEMVLARAALSKPTNRPTGASPDSSGSARVRWRWLVPVSAAAAVAVAVGLSAFALRQAPAPPSAGPVPWLPKVIEAPEEPPPPIPADRGVGRGSAIYQVCEDSHRPATCRDYLLTEDRRHYEIPGSYDKFNNHDEDSTLSPDGRWLGVTRKGKYHLRDLTTGRTRTYHGDGIVGMAWSSNSRWLVVGPAGVGPEPEPVWRVDTRTGRAKRITARFDIVAGTVVDVTRAGDVLLIAADECRRRGPLCATPGPGFRPSLLLVDPDRGAKPVWTRQPNWGVLKESEYPGAIRLTRDDSSLLVALRESVEAGSKAWAPVSGDLMRFDLKTGELTRRYDIPDGELDLTRPKIINTRTNWRLSSYDSAQIVLFGRRNLKDAADLESLVDIPTETRVYVVDSETGAMTTATRVGQDIALIAVRGHIN